jgi:hypothetical protein
MVKKFHIPSHEIRPLAIGRGYCVASDEITLQGKAVGFMYRESPDDVRDSGWRFFSGHETQEYANDPKHFEIYDVNTIANYDPEIVPLLDSPMMSAFERDTKTGRLEPTSFPLSGLQ